MPKRAQILPNVILVDEIPDDFFETFYSKVLTNNIGNQNGLGYGNTQWQIIS
jgi:hypothetical protein